MQSTTYVSSGRRIAGHIASVASVVVFIVSQGACSGSSTDGGDPTENSAAGGANSGTDGGSASGQPASGGNADGGGGQAGGGNCNDACAANEVCNAGKCVALPATCPCPVESYCDLSSNTCIVGCTDDSQCNSNRYCDTASRSCKDGCRTSDDCSATDKCDNHQCVNTCGSCDDANPCTVDTCAKSVCTHVAGNNGAACADDANPCTADVCAAGKCTHGATNEGSTCPTDACTTGAVCKSGACSGTLKAEGTDCGTIAAPALCYQSKCQVVTAECVQQDLGVNWQPSGSDERWVVPGNQGSSVRATACSCSGNTLMGASAMSAKCGVCALAGTDLYMGGSANPDGITTRTYGCF